MNNTQTKRIGQGRWLATLVDAGDESGDLILSLPDELMEEAGWRTGDVLEFKVQSDKCLISKKE